MKNLMTRKHIFGVLMVFVLGFSVQGVCDPLYITPRSNLVQTKSPNDPPFEITFSVHLNSPAIAYNDGSPRKRVTDGNTQAPDPDPTIIRVTDSEDANFIRIDSQGYRVKTVAGTERRIFERQPNDIDLMPTGGGTEPFQRRVTLDTSPSSNYKSSTHELINDDAWNVPQTPYYVDSSNNVYDVNGKAVYIRRPKNQVPRNVKKIGRDSNDDPYTDLPGVYDYTYSRAKYSPITATNPVPVADRFDYNEEAIRVTVPTGISVTVKGTGFTLATGSTTTLTEESGYLKRSMTLVCTTKEADSYSIKIEDATLQRDYPRGGGTVGLHFPHPLDGDATSGLMRDSKTFTLYVTAGPADPTTHVIRTSAGTPHLRVDTPKPVEQVDTHFAIYAADDLNTAVEDQNYEIRYRIRSGSGTLYAATNSDPKTTYEGPSQDLTVHESALVFLNTNRTNNEVAASIAGRESQTFPATVDFQYSGSDRTTTTTTTTTTTPTPPTPTGPSLTLFPSTLSGAPGSTTTLTAIVSNQVQGVPVTFTLSTASGSVLSPIQTNSVGQAQTTILLPSSTATVTVSASGYSPATASISVTGGTPTTPTTPTVSEPASIEIYDGDDQQGEINQRLDEDLVVQVLDRNNNGVSFELVRFRIVEGRGRVSPSSTRTDRDGLADVTFTPRSQGTVEVEAYLGDLSPVTFTVNVGEPPDAIKKISGDNQSGRPGARLANPFVVEVVDENDDPVSGATVAFAVTAGGGSVSPTSATTNASGRAQTVLTLGDEIGDNTVTARVTGLRAVTFRAGAGATGTC